MRLLAPRGEVAARFARVGRPPPGIPWRDASWCALDLELTGLDPRRHDIISVGAVPIEDGRVMLGQSIYTLVRTTQRSDPGAVLVHRLRVADLADAPPLEAAVDLVLEAFTGRVPVFHTGAVERSFLEPLFARRRVRLPAYADTEILGRLWLSRRDAEAPSWLPLARLATELGQPAEIPHHALGDALTTAKTFIALAAHLDADAAQTVASLVEPGGRRRRVRRVVIG